MDHSAKSNNKGESAPKAQSIDYIYDAFASYATDPDGELVREVEAVLEAFHRRRGLPPQYAREIELCVDGRDFVFPRRMAVAPSVPRR